MSRISGRRWHLECEQLPAPDIAKLIDQRLLDQWPFEPTRRARHWMQRYIANFKKNGPKKEP